MPLTREELESLQKTLKEAFAFAQEGFEANKRYGAGDKDLIHFMEILGPVATALIGADAQLRALDEKEPTKLPRLPGKP